MEAGFIVAPISADFVFGSLAPAILADLRNTYEAEVGIRVRHWAMWVFANGSSVPVPTQIDTSRMPAIRACRLLKRSLQQVARVEMQGMSEADRFNIRNAISQLDELHALRIAPGI